MLSFKDSVLVRRIRRAAGNAWVWFAVLGLAAVLIFPFGSLFGGRSTPRSMSQRVERAPEVATDANEAGRAVPLAAVAQPKLKLNAPKVAEERAGVAVATKPRTGARARRMARKATLNLIVGDVGRAIASVESFARAFDGDVTKLDDQRPAAANERHEANLTLVIPADRFDSALTRLANVGGIRSQNVSAEDVGDQIVDQEARLRNLRRTETDLLKIMDRSGKVGEILEVENQMSDVREQIEKLDAETQALKARVATSTIDVHLEEEVRTIGAEPNAASQLGDAWAAAWHASREAALGMTARVFFLIAFAPYWLTLLGIGAIIIVLARRRRLSSSDS